MLIALLAIVVVGSSIVVTVALVALVRLGTRGRTMMQGTHDIEGIYMVVLGTFYAIFVAFMIFVVWSRYYEATEEADREANVLATLYRLSNRLPEPMKTELREASIDYACVMTRYEWPDMAHSRVPRQGNNMVGRIWRLTDSLRPDNVNDEVTRNHVLDAVAELTELRRLRLVQAQTGLPSVFYAVLIFGAVLIVGFACIFSADKFWPHALKASTLAALISFMLLAIWVVDFPFQGVQHVDASAFEHTLSVVEHSGG